MTNQLVKVTLMLILLPSNGFGSECVHSQPGIELSSSLESNNRMAACPGESVVYTCTVANNGVLQWAVESFHRLEGDSILFTIQTDQVGRVVQEEEGLLIANVTKITPNIVHWGNITSTLTIMAHQRFNNKRVWCSNGGVNETSSPCMLNHYGGVPSEPWSPMYTVTSHDTGSYTVLLEWEKSDDGDGLKINNYTTTLTVAHSVHTHVETSNNLYLTLLYNQIYSIQIVAANCAGYGQPVYVPNVSEVNCGLPDLLANETNKKRALLYTHEGGFIQFWCADDEEVITLECLNNGSWNPDPSEIQCSTIQLIDDGHCKTPVLPPHAHIDYERSVLASVIVYQCDSGYKPDDLMVSKCLSGEWSPIITALHCTQQVDCGVPSAPIAGLVHYTSTTENSTVVSLCDVGFRMAGSKSHSVSVCMNNGSWIPIPNLQKCIELPTLADYQTTPSTSAYIIIGLGLFLLLLPLGVFLFCVWVKFCQKEKVREGSQPTLHNYEEVQLKIESAVMHNNDAYGVHVQ